VAKQQALTIFLTYLQLIVLLPASVIAAFIFVLKCNKQAPNLCDADLTKQSAPTLFLTCSQLKVFLPASENTASRIEVPDSFYKLSPSEVRAEAAARKKALENSQLLIPKSFKEKQAQQARDNYKAAMIRVQFPDGMVLEGVFSPQESTTAIYEVGAAVSEREGADVFQRGCLKDVV
jgi:hypothetical protein